MEKKKTMLESVIQQGEFKRKFNFFELYCSLVFLPRAVIKLVKNHKRKLIESNFIERLQLAVTEVNGCAACSYQHTKMALQQGMSNEEISSFLSGEDSFIKPEEAKAIMFAKHFADARGRPQKDTYESIVKEYGKEKSEIILSAVQMIMAGNIMGIPLSAFLSRLQGKRYKKSSLFYELVMLIGGLVILPIATIHGFCRGLMGLPNGSFGKEE